MWSKRNENITVRRGVAVDGLLTGDAVERGRSRTSSVCAPTPATSSLADLVVDAGGRRSTLPALLADDRRARPDRGEGRLRLRLLRPPLPFGRRFGARRCSAPLLMPYELGVDPHAAGRQRHVGRRLIASAKDAALRGLKDVDTWTRTVKSYPARRALARRRAASTTASRSWPRSKTGTARSSIDGTPVATGVLAARRLVGVHEPVGRARHQHRRDPRGRAARPAARPRPPTRSSSRASWHDATMATVEPWYRGNARRSTGAGSPRSTPRSRASGSSPSPSTR